MDTSIFDHSPWLVSEERFLIARDERTVMSLLKGARDSHAFLTLCNNNLDLHFKSVLIKIDANTLQIDKPIEWNGKNNDFQIFFQDSSGCWNMIKAVLVSEGLYDLTISLPDHLYRLKCRRNTRVDSFDEATVSFLADHTALTNLQIVNLSRSGMLVCTRTNGECLPVDSMINNIHITLPEKKFKASSTLVNQGRIVRAFQCRDSQQACHAISFLSGETPAGSALNSILPKE
ncbi:MAG: hypothetical protein KKG47_16220 [Proteobacteria bacterium]|nr:hypothetical protein [Pseudomonadota bacterium]MBU1739623.1 hypothetical protein [Pseudomonadota bacterium]